MSVEFDQIFAFLIENVDEDHLAKFLERKDSPDCSLGVYYVEPKSLYLFGDYFPEGCLYYEISNHISALGFEESV